MLERQKVLIIVESSSEVRTLQSVRLHQWMPGKVNLNRLETIFPLLIELYCIQIALAPISDVFRSVCERTCRRASS